MIKHNYTGPQRVRAARKRREKEPVERMQTIMFWMVYGGFVAWGLFLRAVKLI